jgi:hypothetical protein
MTNFRSLISIWSLPFQERRNIGSLWVMWLVLGLGVTATVATALLSSHLVLAPIGILLSLMFLALLWWVMYANSLVSVTTPTAMRCVPGLRRRLVYATLILWLTASITMSAPPIILMLIAPRAFPLEALELLPLIVAGMATMLCLIMMLHVYRKPVGFSVAFLCLLPLFLNTFPGLGATLRPIFNTLIVAAPALLCFVALTFGLWMFWALFWVSSESLEKRQRNNIQAKAVRAAMILTGSTQVSPALQLNWFGARWWTDWQLKRALRLTHRPEELLLYGINLKRSFFVVMFRYVAVYGLLSAFLLMVKDGGSMFTDEVIPFLAIVIATLMILCDEASPGKLLTTRREQRLLMLLPGAPVDQSVNRWLTHYLVWSRVQALVAACIWVVVFVSLLGNFSLIRIELFVFPAMACILNMGFTFCDYARISNINLLKSLSAAIVVVLPLMIALAGATHWKILAFVIAIAFAIYRYRRMINAPRSLPIGWLAD